MIKRKPDITELIIRSMITETKAARWKYRRHRYPNCVTSPISHTWISHHIKPRIEIECTYYCEDNTFEVCTCIRIPWRSAPIIDTRCKCCPNSKIDYNFRDDGTHSSSRPLELSDPTALPKIIKWLNYRITRLTKQLQEK